METDNHDEQLKRAIAEWRDRHRLREDDAVLLLVELFRIHQRHWEALRRLEMPSFEQFRADITKLSDASRSFQQNGANLLEQLQKHPGSRGQASVTRAAACLAAVAGALAGYLVGRAGL